MTLSTFRVSSTTLLMVFEGGTPVASVDTLLPSVSLSIGRSGTWESEVGGYVLQP